MATRTLIKTTCTRCNGSGKFSFNLTRGTVCFGCEGVGSVMIDPVKQAAAVKAKAKRQAVATARHADMVYYGGLVEAKLQAEFGPFPDTELGRQDLHWACQRANNGKSICDVANDMRQAKI